MSTKVKKRRIWQVIEPGWIKLKCTGYEIIYNEKDGTFKVIATVHIRASEGLKSLKKAKALVKKHKKEMTEMGYTI